MLGHKCSFPNSNLLDSVVGNNKRSSGIDGKTSKCLSRNCLYYHYLRVTFLLATVLWIVKTCDCCFFAGFLMVRTLLPKKSNFKLLKMFGTFSWFCVAYFIYFIFRSTWGTPRQLKTLMCENEQKPELDPEPWKKRRVKTHSSGARAGATFSENPQLRSYSRGHFQWKPTAPELEPGPLSVKTHSSGARAGATFINSGAPEPSCVIFTTAPQPWSCQSTFLK